MTPESVAVHALMLLSNDENTRSQPSFFFNTLASQKVKHYVQPSTPSPPKKKPVLKKQHRKQPASSTRPAPPPRFLSVAALEGTRQELLLELNRQALLPSTAESSPVARSDPWASERVRTQHHEWQQKLLVALSGCSDLTKKMVGPAATHLDPLGAAVWLGSVRHGPNSSVQHEPRFSVCLLDATRCSCADTARRAARAAGACHRQGPP